MDRVWIQADPLRFRISAPGVDVKSASVIDNLIDERVGAVSSISGMATISRRSTTTVTLPLPFSTEVLFGRTFPTPPAFVFTHENVYHNGYVYGLRPWWASGNAWSIEARVYVDRVIFDNYCSYDSRGNYPTDIVYWRAMV